MNLSKLSFISILTVTAVVGTAFAATTGGLRQTPGGEFVIALSDAADEDSAAYQGLRGEEGQKADDEFEEVADTMEGLRNHPAHNSGKCKNGKCT